jgi:uncharacterized membrane protein
MERGTPMHYVDLGLSFILSVLGVLSLIVRRLKTNVWISLLSLILFPAAVYSYYFPQFDRILFGKISIQDVLTYPFVKVLIVFALCTHMIRRKRAAKDKPAA